MLPATRQRWHSRPYPSRSWYSIKRPRRDARLSWSRCARDLPLPSPGSLGWPFPMLEYNYIFSKYYIRKQFYQTALENCYGLKLRKYWLQFKNKFIASFIKSFGTFSWRWWWIWFAWSQSQSKGSEKSTSTAKRILRPRSCLCMEQFTVFCCWGFVCQRVQVVSKSRSQISMTFDLWPLTSTPMNVSPFRLLDTTCVRRGWTIGAKMRIFRASGSRPLHVQVTTYKFPIRLITQSHNTSRAGGVPIWWWLVDELLANDGYCKCNNEQLKKLRNLTLLLSYRCQCLLHCGWGDKLNSKNVAPPSGHISSSSVATCAMMECCRVDDTSPERAATGLSPGLSGMWLPTPGLSTGYLYWYLICT